MLTKRQRKLLKVLEDHKDSFIKGNQIAEAIDCSIKTMRTDFRVLRECVELNGCCIESVTSKGYCMRIEDKIAFELFKNQEINEQSQSADFNHHTYRVTYILMKLLAQDVYVKSEDLAEEMYISRSRVSQDLKSVREILTKYNLELQYMQGQGMRIKGTEKYKRLCIVKEHLPLNAWYNFYQNEPEKTKMIADISNILVETLMKSHYKISDIVFQNLVLHLYVAVNRMLHKGFIEKEKTMDTTTTCAHEVLIAQTLLKKLQQLYPFEIQENEVQFLAISLLGKRSYDAQDAISSQTDTIVNDILEVIKAKMDIDFSSDVELRISLALHIVPLLSRIKLDMQLKNTMVKEIKQHFTLAYDIATIAASYLSQSKNIRLSEDEIAYLAVHFNLTLQKNENKVNPKKVLIICNSRRGDSLMLQHTFLTSFNEMIAKLEIINAIEIPLYKIEEYDCIFATYLNHPNIPKNAIRINFFMDGQDKARIGRALKGEKEAQEIVKFFDEDLCICCETQESKSSLLKKMCELANTKCNFDTDLYEAVMERENLGYTTFGNSVALPHPDALISDNTIVVSAIMKEPVDWGIQKVRLIFLICVKKGNQKDLRSLFECLSNLMADESSIDKIIQNRSYEVLKNKLAELIS